MLAPAAGHDHEVVGAEISHPYLELEAKSHEVHVLFHLQFLSRAGLGSNLQILIPNDTIWYQQSATVLVDNINLMSTDTMPNSQMSVRLDSELKEQAEAVLKKLGMSTADYTRVAFSQLVLQQGIPFEMRIPNAETQAALDEPKENALRFSRAEEMMAHIDNMPDEEDQA